MVLTCIYRGLYLQVQNTKIYVPSDQLNVAFMSKWSLYTGTGKPVLRDHGHDRPRAVLKDHIFLAGPTGQQN